MLIDDFSKFDTDTPSAQPELVEGPALAVKILFSSPPRRRGSRFLYKERETSGIPAFAGMTGREAEGFRKAFDRFRVSGDGYGVPRLTGWRWAPAFAGGPDRVRGLA